MKRIFAGFIIVALFLISQPAFAAKARAVIKGTEENSPITGEVLFTELKGGIEVRAQVAGVPPGKHGFHIHENGSCDDQGKAAGSHYNPDGAMHGLVITDGFARAHAGDFGNIEVNDNGIGNLKIFVPGLTLSGLKYNIAGKAVILHEKTDDFGQPTGNAGGRIGCGTIQVFDSTDYTEPMQGQGGRPEGLPGDASKTQGK